MQQYTGFVYLWHDRKRNYFCIGSHMGTTDDGYISSTGKFLKVYKRRPEDFKRRIIHYHSGDYKSLLEQEQKYLNMINPEELFSSKNQKAGTCRYYNMKSNASGISGEVASELRKQYFQSEAGKKWKQTLSEKFKNDNPCKPGNIPWNKGLYGFKHSAKSKKTISMKLKGRKFSKIHRERISDSHKGKVLSYSHKEKIRQANIGKKQTDYQKQIASKANSKTWVVLNPDGIQETVFNLRQYCLERNLDNGNLMKTLKSGKCKGYKVINRIDA